MSAGTRFGRYELVERITAGGMAEIFRARHESGGIVALKRILPAVAADEEFTAMFEDEARIASRLKHPNIARWLDFGQVDGAYYIAFEYVHGKDLRAVFDSCVQAGHTPPLALVVAVLTHIADGLAYAHTCRDTTTGKPIEIVHRDVSPQNIMISTDGDAKLIDFGIAKATGRRSRTQVGIIKGKFGYMAPEQVKGATIDGRTDVFALGICAWELLTGERLFRGGSELQIMRKINDFQPTPPSSINSRIDGELDAIVVKALAKRAADRYGSARDLHRELRAYAATRGGLATREEVAATMRQLFPLLPAVTSGVDGPGEIGRLLDVTAPEGAILLGPGERQETGMSGDGEQDKRGSDLDIFEGLGKKSVPRQSAAGSPSATKVAIGKRTLVGVSPPANLPPERPNNPDDIPTAPIAMAHLRAAMGQPAAPPAPEPEPTAFQQPPPQTSWRADQTGPMPAAFGPTPAPVATSPAPYKAQPPPPHSARLRSAPPAAGASASPSGLPPHLTEPTRGPAAPPTLPAGGAAGKPMDWDEDEATHLFDKKPRDPRPPERGERGASEAPADAPGEPTVVATPVRSAPPPAAGEPPQRGASSPPVAPPMASPTVPGGFRLEAGQTKPGGSGPPPSVRSSEAAAAFRQEAAQTKDSLAVFARTAPAGSPALPPGGIPPPPQTAPLSQRPAPAVMPTAAPGSVAAPPPPGMLPASSSVLPPAPSMPYGATPGPPPGYGALQTPAPNDAGSPDGHGHRPHPSQAPPGAAGASFASTLPSGGSGPYASYRPGPYGRQDATVVREPGPKLGMWIGIGALALLGAIAAGVLLLMPRAGKLTVSVKDAAGASPARVEVFVDGKKQCDTSPCVVEVTAGKHAVKAIGAAGEAVEQTVATEGRKEASLDLVLAGPAKSTGVKVTGTQPGAKLSVDGKDYGPLPQEIKDLPPGEHKVRVTASERYEPLEKTVTVAKDEMVDVGTVTLKVLKGKATISLGTQGAKVYLVSGNDRRDLPTFPISVDIDTSKSWTLEGTKAGLQDYRQPISFADGQAEKTYNVLLEPKSAAPAAAPAPAAAGASKPSTPSTPATPKAPAEGNDKPETSGGGSAGASSGETALNLNSIPASSIILDGKNLGNTPKKGQSVEPGPHTVVFVNAELGLKKSMTVNVAKGETKTVIGKLRE